MPAYVPLDENERPDPTNRVSLATSVAAERRAATRPTKEEEPAADARIARVATRQRGLVTTEQLLALGLTRDAIRQRVRTGRLHRIHRGVYAVGHAALPAWGREQAALLAVGPGAALSHASAAAAWGLAPAPPRTVHVTTPDDRRHRRGVQVHRAALPAAGVRHCHGLRVTSPARTILDLAATGTAPRELERLVAEARVQRLLRAGEPEVPDGHRGATDLRAVLDAGPRLTRSEAERLLLDLVREAGLPLPETNVRVAGFEVDALWREQRLVVEVDGYATHGHRRAFEADRRKVQALAAAGLRVAGVSYVQLTRERMATAVRLAQALAYA